MFTFEEMEEISRRRDEVRRTGVSIYAAGGSRSWSVTVAIGRSPNPVRQHRKTIRGTKKEAQAYADWIKELAAAGNKITSAVSQSELKQLRALQSGSVPIQAAGRSRWRRENRTGSVEPRTESVSPL